MKSLLNGFLSAWMLVSRIPVTLRGEPDYSRVGFWMPLVGWGAAAAACAGAGLGLALFGPGVLAAVVAMTAQYLAFNLFHLDGLLDTADAAGVQGNAEKRRMVLKDPRIGSFAFFAGFIVLSGRLWATASLFSAGGAAVWGSLILAPVAGRFASMLVPSMSIPCPGGGLATVLGKPSPVEATIGYTISAIPAAIIIGVQYGPVGVMLSLAGGGAAAIIVALALGFWYRRQLDGYSGDALGAAVELTELIVLLASCAVFRRPS
jgi:adenosylcobinamide-GDP ribazoletransferase